MWQGGKQRDPLWAGGKQALVLVAEEDLHLSRRIAGAADPDNVPWRIPPIPLMCKGDVWDIVAIFFIVAFFHHKRFSERRN